MNVVKKVISQFIPSDFGFEDSADTLGDISAVILQSWEDEQCKGYIIPQGEFFSDAW